MKRKIIGIFVCMLMIGTTTLAVADWKPGDGYKMHFPQMPDEVGWDVNFHDYYLADDWQCSETGPVTDIHFWISWRHDIVVDLPYIKIDIYSNNPQPPSKPLEQLWTRTFTPDQFVIKGPFTGDQGWLEPYGEYFLHDHLMYYQVNIKNIQQPFVQQNKTIYWLVIQMQLLYPIELGWKTSKDLFMDAAVWGSPGQWNPIIDPVEGTPINFAFVITGPPPIPDLDCNGTLRWTKVKAGSTVTGSFIVGNIGQAGSLLDWEVSSYPSWGTWTFNPANGNGLPAGSWVTVNVSVVAPTQKNTQFTGTIEVRNKNNFSDNCTIQASLKTPRSKTSIDPLFINLLQRFFRQFPVLHWILNPK